MVQLRDRTTRKTIDRLTISDTKSNDYTKLYCSSCKCEHSRDDFSKAQQKVTSNASRTCMKRSYGKPMITKVENQEIWCYKCENPDSGKLGAYRPITEFSEFQLSKRNSEKDLAYSSKLQCKDHPLCADEKNAPPIDSIEVGESSDEEDEEDEEEEYEKDSFVASEYSSSSEEEEEEDEEEEEEKPPKKKRFYKAGDANLDSGEDSSEDEEDEEEEPKKKIKMETSSTTSSTESSNETLPQSVVDMIKAEVGHDLMARMRTQIRQELRGFDVTKALIRPMLYEEIKKMIQEEIKKF
jgi:hypothetical protein